MCILFIFFNHAVKFYLIELQCVVPVFVSRCCNRRKGTIKKQTDEKDRRSNQDWRECGKEGVG